jgi:hypothetical protein
MLTTLTHRLITSCCGCNRKNEVRNAYGRYKVDAGNIYVGLEVSGSLNTPENSGSSNCRTSKKNGAQGATTISQKSLFSRSSESFSSRGTRGINHSRGSKASVSKSLRGDKGESYGVHDLPEWRRDARPIG